MKLLLLFFLALFPILASAQVTVIDSIQSGGIWRNYRLYLPANYNANTSLRPLILNLHGLGSNALEQENYGDFRAIADTAGFITVHPNGTVSSIGRYWNAGFFPAGTDDVTFLSALIDTLKARYRVDAQRVYSTGMSNGGFMSYYLASKAPQKVAAIASVTGAILPAGFPPQDPGRPVPVMEIHGTADVTVPYTGGTNNVHIDTLVKYWVGKNGCNPTPQMTAVPNTSTTDGCTAERYVWSGGAAGSVVELFKIIGGGHTWPGSVFPIPGIVTNQDFSASSEIWRFFRPYTLNALTASVGSSAGRQSISLRAVPNPVRDVLRVEGGGAGSFTVTDALGRAVLQTTQASISTRSLPVGVYQLRFDGVKGSGSVQFVKE